MLRIAIVDDDAKFQKRLKEFITRFFRHETGRFCVRRYGGGVTFLSKYPCDFDIVFNAIGEQDGHPRH